MIPQPGAGRALWRVGHYADPLGFAPRELYEFSHRFDDIRGRFRTLYCAELPETCLREVLADFRPNLGAMRRHVGRYGPEAAQDFTPEPVTAQWRRQHVLVAVELELDGPLVDLTDVPTRQELEDRHLDLLVEHGLQHLDLHEITTSGARSRRRSPPSCSTGAPARSGSPPAWTATPASPSSRAVAPPSWPETLFR